MSTTMTARPRTPRTSSCVMPGISRWREVLQKAWKVRCNQMDEHMKYSLIAHRKATRGPEDNSNQSDFEEPWVLFNSVQHFREFINGYATVCPGADTGSWVAMPR